MQGRPTAVETAFAVMIVTIVNLKANQPFVSNDCVVYISKFVEPLLVFVRRSDTIVRNQGQHNVKCCSIETQRVTKLNVFQLIYSKYFVMKIWINI
jgi:hypothetical protein